MPSLLLVPTKMIQNTATLILHLLNNKRPMPKQIYDVIVVGTGAGGGMAIKTLCEAGLKVCALNAGRRLDPEKDFRFHRMPWEMKFRGFDDPKRGGESYGYLDNEYTKAAWEHEIPFTTAPGTKWMWRGCFSFAGRQIS